MLHCLLNLFKAYPHYQMHLWSRSALFHAYFICFETTPHFFFLKQLDSLMCDVTTRTLDKGSMKGLGNKTDPAVLLQTQIQAALV